MYLVLAWDDDATVPTPGSNLIPWSQSMSLDLHSTIPPNLYPLATSIPPETMVRCRMLFDRCDDLPYWELLIWEHCQPQKSRKTRHLPPTILSQTLIYRQPPWFGCT